jgi:hypothetical protein
MKTLNVRMDDDLHARLKATADHDQRSLNAEITWLLRAALEQKEAEHLAGLLRERLEEKAPEQEDAS